MLPHRLRNPDPPAPDRGQTTGCFSGVDDFRDRLAEFSDQRVLTSGRSNVYDQLIEGKSMFSKPRLSSVLLTATSWISTKRSKTLWRLLPRLCHVLRRCNEGKGSLTATRPNHEFHDEEASKPVEAGLYLSGLPLKSTAETNKQDIHQAAAKSEEVSAPPEVPTRATRRRRTGRSAQLNLKVRQDTIDAFYAIADKHGWVLGEAFEKAVELLERENR